MTIEIRYLIDEQELKSSISLELQRRFTALSSKESQRLASSSINKLQEDTKSFIYRSLINSGVDYAIKEYEQSEREVSIDEYLGL